MKLSTLLFAFFLSHTICAQTKTAEFKKTEDILKKSNGLVTPDFKVIDQTFSEKSLKLNAVSGGISGSRTGSDLEWEGFTFSVTPLKSNAAVSELNIFFDEEITVSVFEDSKLLDKEKLGTAVLYIQSEDAKAMEEQLQVLQSFTWKTLNKLRTSKKEELVKFITEKLDESLEDINWKVKFITDCEIGFVSTKKDEITVPTRKLKIHEKDFLSEEYLFCYGKQFGVIKTKINQIMMNRYMEHPDLEFAFGEDPKLPVSLEYAIRRLSASCNW